MANLRKANSLEKITDVVIWISGVTAATASWIVNKLWKSIDLAHSRIDKIESKVVSCAFLESQLSPIRNDLNMILKHLLEHRKTEGQKNKLNKE